ncbi:hypothetical protein DFS33DRAFT_1271266 [Desarmillaria ectypa]|nr:hypothetical protein DFS33DRAFT_1271266 [Desarmillaria ectypa]
MTSAIAAWIMALPSNIPMLKMTGDNWYIFYLYFSTGVQAKGKWDHFDGSKSQPVLSAPTTTLVDELDKDGTWYLYSLKAFKEVYGNFKPLRDLLPMGSLCKRLQNCSIDLSGPIEDSLIRLPHKITQPRPRKT